MINLEGKKRDAYSEGELAELESSLKDYWEKSRTLESKTVNDLEKHLWLVNGAAATVSIGLIQAQANVSLWQFAGAWLFVSGIVMLVILKYVSSVNSSRDRYRFQEAKSRFDAGEVTDHVFQNIRDRTFRVFKRAYLVLQWGAGGAFIVGCIFTLVGVARAA